MICTRWVENLSVRLRFPSAGSPVWQTTRSIDVSHAESALVQLGDALGHRSCQNPRKTIRRANLPTRSHTSPMARAQAGGFLAMGLGSLTHLLSSGRPSWQIGATLRATPGGYTGKSGRARKPYFTGISRSCFIVAVCVVRYKPVSAPNGN